MKSTDMRELRTRFAAQHGVVAREELRALGIDSRTELRRVEAGEWEGWGKRVVRLVAAPVTVEQSLMAACIEGGNAAIASHQSAVWLWNLAPAPRRHSVIVPRSSKSRIGWADVHRLEAPFPDVVRRRNIRVTNPLRALVDFAAVAGDEDIDSAVDRALASGLVTVEGIAAEVNRLGRRGRPGIGPMRRALKRRGFSEAPHPSVLESRMLRLLQSNGIPVLRTETWVGESGRYRVDAEVSADVLVEVDGYAFHHSPEQKTEDERRRNRIRLTGKLLLVYTWRDVVYDKKRVVAEVRDALALAWFRRLEGRREGRTGRQLTGSASQPPVL